MYRPPLTHPPTAYYYYDQLSVSVCACCAKLCSVIVVSARYRISACSVVAYRRSGISTAAIGTTHYRIVIAIIAGDTERKVVSSRRRLLVRFLAVILALALERHGLLRPFRTKTRTLQDMQPGDWEINIPHRTVLHQAARELNEI